MSLTIRAALRAAATCFCTVAALLSVFLPERSQAASKLDIPIVYITRAEEPRLSLSFVDPVAKEPGVWGARLALKDNQTTGDFLGDAYSLIEVIVPTDGDVVAAFEKERTAGRRFFVADLRRDDLLSIAQAEGVDETLIFNACVEDRDLRRETCFANVFHTALSTVMQADGLMQFLVWKRWPNIFLLEGSGPDDADYTEAIRQSARKFGAEIVEEETYSYSPIARRTDSRHIQVQTQMPMATQAAGDDYDVLVVADRNDLFSEYLPFNTYAPRPVAGHAGAHADVLAPGSGTMGFDPDPAPFREGGRTLDGGARLRHVAGGARRQRGGDSHLLGRSGQGAGLFARGGFRTRRVQMHLPVLSAVNPADAPADAFDQQADSGFRLAATGLPASTKQARQPRLRQAGDVVRPAIEGKRMSDFVKRTQRLVSARTVAATLAAATLAAAFISSAPVAVQTIFVSNEKGNSITVIDAKTREVTATIPVGERPRDIALSPDGKTLYICASDEDHIEILDTESLEVTGTLPSGPDPELMTIAPDGSHLYAANKDDNLVTAIDLATGDAVAEVQLGVEPEGMGVSPDGRTIVNTSETTNMAHFIDADSFEITANVLVDQRPRFAQYTDDRAEVWVSAEIGGTVAVIDAETKEIKKKISFSVPGLQPEAIQPVGIRITKDRSKAFVALGPANRVAVINAQTLEVEDYLLVGQWIWQLPFTPDESELYATNGVSNDVSVIDVENLKTLVSIPVRSFPWWVAIKPWERQR
ncbi:PQQ-dependent catabolism-associated beta-propeller protein [Breoghania sp.]|uniref:PQQ-dependent catabolism-associated beta-propeller protein n=1 Tax=Breoghania sp. TaxID=2065378 RepID=UPI003204C13D